MTVYICFTEINFHLILEFLGNTKITFIFKTLFDLENFFFFKNHFMPDHKRVVQNIKM